MVYFVVDGKVEEIVPPEKATLIDFVENHFLGVFVGYVPEHDSGSTIPLNRGQVDLKFHFLNF